MKTQTTQINVSPHEGQHAVHSDPARFKVLASGRRWGKTRLGVNECLDYASQGKRAWWVAPSYKMGAVGWRPLMRIGSKIGAEVRRGDRQVLLPHGGEVCVRSADDPQSLCGEGLDFVVLDECAFMQQEAWTEALRPALSDRVGSALFISTPKGHNFFWQLWNRGQDNTQDEWKSWRYPTADNPYIDPKEIEAARNNLPERVFAQEYLAEFIEDAGDVFRGVMDAATATEQDMPINGHEYVFGVDWGKSNDFTVITVIDLYDNSMACMDRFNQIDYVVQMDRLKALVKRFGPSAVVVETNSMGTPLVDQLSRTNIPIKPFTTTSATKSLIIDGLALAFERKELRLLNSPILVSELQAYEMERMPSGMFRYSAPSGMHDDCVMSLALAWYGSKNKYGKPGAQKYV